MSTWTELTCYSPFSLIRLPAWDTLLRAHTHTHTRRRHAEHAAPRLACRASLNCLHVVGLPRALVTWRPSRRVGSCTSSRNNKHIRRQAAGTHGCVPLGVGGGWGTHRLTSNHFLAGGIYPQGRGLYRTICPNSRMRVSCLLTRAYRGEADRASRQARCSGALFSEEVKALPSDEDTQASTRRRVRENTVRPWYQNVQRLMSCILAEPPAFKGKAITERAGRRPSMQCHQRSRLWLFIPGLLVDSAPSDPSLADGNTTVHAIPKDKGRRQPKACAYRRQSTMLLLPSTLGRTPWGRATLER